MTLFRFVKATLLFSSIILLGLVTASAATRGSDNPFPEYSSIAPNVHFWKMIFSRYHSQQGLIHDSEDVSIVYEVLDLTPGNQAGSRRADSRLIRKTSEKYKKMLEQLATGKQPISPEEIRIASLFGANPDPLALLRAADTIRFQRGLADRFRQGIIRSGRYLQRIKEIFRQYDLPEDLAYLPHVESSFNYNAYSKFGAAGIWQFTYGTGKRFMTIDYTVDERRDPIISAYAAAKLLKQNYEKLGNWALAITAYNHGVNSMLRAQREKGDYETIVNEYDGRRFKFASKNFYPSFLAAREIGKNVETYFGKLEMEKPIPTEIVTLPGFAPVDKIARHFLIDIQTIRSLNPALRKPVFDDQKYIPKGYVLHLPQTESIKALTRTMPDDLFAAEQKRSRFYYVRKGDVAGAIARQHGITLQELIWANNLNHRATIYVGQNLRIPTPEDSIALAAKHAEEVASTLHLEQKKTTRDTLPRVELVENGETKLGPEVNLAVVTGHLTVQSVFKKGDRSYGIIRVDTGETLGHYADWLGVSTQTIRQSNRFSYGRVINYNDRIIIPLDRVSKERFEEKRYEYHKEFEEDFLSAFVIESVTTYEVKLGDNIWTLCQNEFELPFWLIRKFNQNVNLERLRPLQKIVVPIVEKAE